MKIGILLLVIFYWYFELAFVKVKKLNISNDKNVNLKFVQISDFHNNKLINIRNLKNGIEKFNPDVIFITGDLISRDTQELDRVEKFLKLISNYEIFFVSGNHEVENKKTSLEEIFKKHNIINLDNSVYELEIDNNIFRIFGEGFAGFNKNEIDEKFYNILLVHNPNQFVNNYKKYDLVLSGHKHGGQVRIPFIGQIIDHGMKFFPKYSMGIYEIEQTKLYIDAGLGQSIYLRIFNRVSYTQGTIGGEQN